MQRKMVAAAVLVLLVCGVLIAIVDPFSDHSSTGRGVLDNAAPTSTRRIARTTLASQTQVGGTLGYAGTWTVSVPSTSGYGSQPIYTWLPSPGQVVARAERLLSIDGQPTLLMYGSTPAWRAFAPGMSRGPDVSELNANLRALGYHAPTGDTFTAATSAAISALQRAHGLSPTGMLELGAIAFEPGAFRVTAVASTLGAPAQPGPALNGTSTRHDVSVQLDAGQQSEVKVGDRVTVTLPDNTATPAVVSAVGKVASVPTADQQSTSGSSSPTIDVDVRLLHPSVAARLDQAPVEVSITEQTARNVLAVPVNALIALAGGGYAVEVVEANGAHRLVAVTPGLFDDAQGLVQVSGHGLAAGQRVVVPAS